MRIRDSVFQLEISIPSIVIPTIDDDDDRVNFDDDEEEDDKRLRAANEGDG